MRHVGGRPPRYLPTTLATLMLVSLMPATGACEAPRVDFLNDAVVLPADLPFSEAVRVDGMLYLSGQIGVKPGTMTLVEGGMTAEARQTLDNIKAVLEAHGHSLHDVVKCTVMLADIGEWGAFNEVYQSYFSSPYPARSAFGASGLAMGARLELECMAAVEAEKVAQE